MKEVLGYILQARGTPISWQSISRETSLSSPHTAQAYVVTLEKLLLAVALEFISPSGKVMKRKNRKIHFSDPLVYHTFSIFSRANIDEPAMVEGLVASHLSRRYDVYYRKNGSEVDVIVKHDKTMTGIETKWGFGRSHRPRHLSRFMSLDRETVPLFLASLRP